ncbi:MAG: IucA/IucC family protein [Streptosporangiaceae bacterium]|jgi:siderophore synthetase component
MTPDNGEPGQIIYANDEESLVNPDMLTAQALLNCLVREVSGPERQTWETSGRLTIRLARTDRLLRVRTRRPSAGPSPRLTGEAELLTAGTWRPVNWEQLTTLIERELALATGTANDEFAGHVMNSHEALTAIVRARGSGADSAPGDRVGQYLASEQSLVAAHRFHPAPKAREGDPRDWLPFAPEAGARFPLRFLAVRGDTLAAEGDVSALDGLGCPAPPPGYHVLPAHPWQLRLLADRPWLADAFRNRRLLDLGAGSAEVVPTSSVRTVYVPGADIFCKFSLNVRITNCVRKNSWYELAGSVALTDLLTPVFDDMAVRFPGTALLGEPGYRTAALPDQEATEALSVIVRDGLSGKLAPEVTPVLAASLTEPPDPRSRGPLDDRDPDWLLSWWEAYVRKVAPPVLHALFDHGVVLEPHLQNVLVGMDSDGLPAQAIFRDLEGVKLDQARHEDFLATLKPGVAQALAYEPERGWNRVAYCLFVNHLTEIAAAIADRHPSMEDRLEVDLWCRARDVLAGFARDHDWPPELRAALAGVPFPAKANLRLRWARAADREADYTNVRNPLSQGVTVPC